MQEMSTAEGYVFYCSKCKFDHAGECLVVENPCKPASLDGYPSLGSKWQVQDWDFVASIWNPRKGRWYQVAVLDPNASAVVVDTHSDPTKAPWRQSVPVKAFRKEGIDNHTTRFRMKEIS